MTSRQWLKIILGGFVVGAVVGLFSKQIGPLVASLWEFTSQPAVTNVVQASTAVVVAVYAVLQVIQNRQLHNEGIHDEKQRRAEDERTAAWVIGGEVARIEQVAVMWTETDLLRDAVLRRFQPDACLIQDWYAFAQHLRLMGPASAHLATQAVKLSTDLHSYAYQFHRRIEDLQEAQRANDALTRTGKFPLTMPVVDMEELRPLEEPIKKGIVELAALMRDVRYQAVRSNEPVPVSFKPDELESEIGKKVFLAAQEKAKSKNEDKLK